MGVMCCFLMIATFQNMRNVQGKSLTYASRTTGVPQVSLVFCPLLLSPRSSVVETD